ncbi:MAG TPA: tetratricopeptide repeat protein [Terriglobia bacterium]|nr:tetratricopeptide repeat protein [Terriglobia bacterium]
MRKQAWAFLLVGFIIGFGALYTWTKKRAPDIVRAIPVPVESLGPAGSVSGPGPEEPPPPPLDTARLQQLETELKNNPKNIEALTELGNMHFDQKNYPQAIDLYKKVLELQPGNVEVSTDIGTALFYSNHFDEAIAQFRKTLGLDPNHPRTLFNLGVALLHGKNDALGAIQAWERLVQNNPNFPQVDLVKEQIRLLKEREKKP